MNFGELAAIARVIHGYRSQEDLAIAAKLHQATIQRYEKTEKASAHIVDFYEEVLGWKMREICAFVAQKRGIPCSYSSLKDV